MIDQNSETKRTVLFVGNFLSSSRSGSRGICEELSDRLRLRAWRVITTSHYTHRIVRVVDMMRTIIAQRHSYQVASVDVYSGAAFLWAVFASVCLRLCQKPYLLILRGGGLVEFSKKWPQLTELLFANDSTVVTPSLFLQHGLQRFCKDIYYIKNGLDLSKYPFRSRNQVTPKLIWLRALHQIYQPEMAVQCLALLLPEFPNMELLMVGPDKGDGTRQQLERMAFELEVQDALQWIGPVKKADVPQYLNQSGIFLNTTRYESFGVSVMEAAACGLRIVTTNVGEIPYLWQNNHDALLVPPGDVQTMAAAVRRILTKPELAETLSSNARAKAEKYDWSVILPRWEQLFVQLLDQKG